MKVPNSNFDSEVNSPLIYHFVYTNYQIISSYITRAL
jgi:hypothetical protein